MLEQLQMLKIKDDLNHEDLVRLQRFTQLKHLEIGRLVFGEKNETVRFLNLKILYVLGFIRPNDQGSYIIDSPLLTAVFFGNLKSSLLGTSRLINQLSAL